MKKRNLILVAFLAAVIFAAPAYGQQGNMVLQRGSGAPSDPCPNNLRFYIDTSNGEFYDCQANSWNKVGPGAAGAVNWNSINNPDGNQALTMAARTTTFTWGSATGAGVDMFSFLDTTGNTGTGYVVSISTTGTSAAKAVRITDGGTANGVEMSTSAVLQAIGTGSILADNLQTNTIGALTDFDSTLCGTTEILEDQGGSWACIATPGGGGGLTHTVNASALASSTALDLDDATPAAPANSININWQKDALDPTNISANILLTDLDGVGIGVSGTELILDLSQLTANQTVFDGGQATQTITFSLSGATDPVATLADGVFNLTTGTLQQNGDDVIHKDTNTLLSTENVILDGSSNPRDITLGIIRILQTPNIDSTRGIAIITDAAGFGDTKALEVDWTATGVAAGDFEAVIDLDIDTANSSGGTIIGLEITGTDTGSATVYGMLTGVGINPILNEAGVFGNVETAFTFDSVFTDVTADFNSTASDVQMFVSNGDLVYIGMAALFDEVEFILAVTASNAGIQPIFEYSDGATGWITFSPTDNTNGMRQNGDLVWIATSLAGWAQDTVNSISGKFWIRITRGAVTVATPPTEDLVQVNNDLDFMWDSSGNLNVASLSSGFNAEIADAGFIRCANNEICMAWELATPGADKTLIVDADDILQFNGTFNPVQMRFTAIAAPSYVAGQLFYDSGNESLTFHNNESDVALQIGQETWIRVRNESGSTISNGQVVYIDGSASGLPRIALARADASTTAEAVGLATHDIETASTGYVTAYGTVRDFDTSGFTLADRVFLSASVAGAITNTAPSDPNFVVSIGIVTEVNVSTGDVLVTLGAPRFTGGSGILLDGSTISTLSSEENFLVSGALSCGANTAGKMQTHTTPLQYCDNAGTPVLQYAAYAASDGDALAGATATAFFDAGTIEATRLPSAAAATLGVIELDNALAGTAAAVELASGVAGDGIVLNTATAPDSLDVDLNTTIDGVGSASNLSGMEITATSELALLQGCADTQILKYTTTGDLWECQNDNDSGGAPAWETLVNSANTATLYTSDNVLELMDYNFTASYGGTDIGFQVSQLTGNPVAGSILADFRAADTDIVVLRAGDGTNGVTVSQAGALTAEGTGTITATDLAASTIDATTDLDPALCATSQILERQGAVWACTATPAGGNVDLLDGSVHQDTLAGTVVLGDIIHGNVTPAWARLAGNITTTKQFLTQTGSGAASAVPVWGVITTGDIQELIALADLTDVASTTGSGTVAVLSTTPTFTTSVISPAYISGDADPADGGVLRVGNAEDALCSELATPGTDPCLQLDASDIWQLDGTLNVQTAITQGGTQVVLESRTITVAGTTNEIASSAGAQDLSANRTWTLSLPATIDLGGKTSFEIPNSAAPTVDAFGEIAGDNDFYAASRGVATFYDGTSATHLVGVLNTSAASSGQVPTFVTGGTITWQTPAGSGDVTAVGPGCAAGDCFTDGVVTTGTVFSVWEGTGDDANEFTINVPANPGADIGWTVPDAATALTFFSGTDTVVGRATTDTLTNKTADGGLATTTHAAGANFISVLRHATDCTAITDGKDGEMCWEADASTFFVCEPSAGDCDTAGEWTVLTAAADGFGYDEILDEASGLIKRPQLNFTGAGVACVDNPGATRTDCDISGAAGNEFADNLFRVTDDGDNTAKLAFQVSPVDTATVRTVTVQNVDLVMAGTDIDNNFSVAQTFQATIIGDIGGGGGLTLQPTGTGETTISNASGAPRHKFFTTSDSIHSFIPGNRLTQDQMTVHEFTAGESITAGQLLKLDTTTAMDVLIATTSDTENIVGISRETVSAAAGVDVIVHGIYHDALLGTGTCSVGDYVIPDTTTNGRIKCSATLPTTAVVGIAMAAVSVVGDPVRTFVNVSINSVDGGGGGDVDLLDGSVHQDTAAQGASIGSLIVGVTGPTWDELTIGGADTFLGSDGTDATWTALTLASAQFANQGTTTTLLHGNAAGNPSFGSVVPADMDLTATYAFSATANTFVGTSYTSPDADPADTGLIRAGNDEDILCAERATPGVDVCMHLNTNDDWEFQRDIAWHSGTAFIGTLTHANTANRAYDFPDADGPVSLLGQTIDLTAEVTGILPGANGGTNNGFLQFVGPTTSLKTWTGPDASANLLTDNAAVTNAQGGTGIDTSGSTGVVRIDSGTTTVTELSGDVTTSGSNATSIASGVVSSTELATANTIFDKSIVLIDPTTAEDDKIQWMHGKAVTYTDVDCSTDAGTVTIDMDHRVITTPNTVGTDILTGTIVCDTDNQADGGFADATIPANVPVNLSITAVSGAGTVRIHIRGTVD